MQVFEIARITSVAMKSMADLYETDIRSKIMVAGFSPIFCVYLGFISSFSTATGPPLSAWWSYFRSFCSPAAVCTAAVRGFVLGMAACAGLEAADLTSAGSLEPEVNVVRERASLPCCGFDG